MEKIDHKAIKTEIKNISKSIDRILRKVAEYNQPTHTESERIPKEREQIENIAMKGHL